MEQFKKIKDFPNYSVSNLGKVRNDKTGRILKFYTKPSGYKQVEMGHRTKPRYVHRLVAEAFIPNVDNKPQVDHINGDKGDNRVENLKWVTVSENVYGYGYDSRIEHRKRKVIATRLDGRQITFNSRKECVEYFKTKHIRYGRYYTTGNKKGWKFEIMR